MELIWKIIIGIGIYLLIVFVIPYYFFPGFAREVKVMRTEKIKKIAKKLRGKNKEETLMNVFNYVQETYSSWRHLLFILINKHFWTDVDKIVDKKQFLPCHLQSLVFKTLLINTGQFNEKDLKKKIVMRPYGMIHEYYFVKVNGKVFRADPFYNKIKEMK